MTSIKTVIRTRGFEKGIKKIRDRQLLERIKKNIVKIIENPKTGKPLRYALKGERSIHLKPYRLVYAMDNDKLILLRFMHRKRVYR